MQCMTSWSLVYTMTSSYLNDMYDVTGVNVFPRKLMAFPRKEKVNSVPYPLLNLYTMFHSVCCLFHAESCCLPDCEKSSVLLTI